MPKVGNLDRRIDKLREESEEFLIRHENPDTTTNLVKYANDPIGFITDILGEKPWEKQVEITESLLKNQRVTVRSCNSVGKDWLAGRLVLWWVYCRRGSALLTGPTQRQVRKVMMRDNVAKAFRKFNFEGTLNQEELVFPPGDPRGILAFTSTDANRMTGFHSPRTLVVITEAQAVDDFVWEGLEACATAEHDRFLSVGNPTVTAGEFHEAHTSPESDWDSFCISAFDHPNVIEGKELIPGAITLRWVNRQKKKYGEDSPFYRSRVLGEFPEGDEHTLIFRRWLENTGERWEPPGNYGPGVSAPYKKIFGVDVARSPTGDRNAVSIARELYVDELHSWHGTGDTMDSVKKLQALFRNHGYRPGPSNLYRIMVDEIGIGVSVLDRLRELKWKARGLNVSSTDMLEPDRFINVRAEGYWYLRELLQEGAIGINPNTPHLDELFEELEAIRYTLTPSGKVKLEDKRLTSKRLGRSPDLADAFMLSLYKQARAVGGGAGFGVIF